MKKLFIIFAIAGPMTLAGCTTMSNENQGALGGAIIGGAVGHNFGSGTGKALATFAGALIGAFAGANIGRQLDAYDAKQAQQALEYNRTGQRSTWRNPDQGHQMSMTPTKTLNRYRTGYDSTYCREFQTTITVGGRSKDAYGTACRKPDGSWEIVK